MLIRYVKYYFCYIKLSEKCFDDIYKIFDKTDLSILYYMYLTYKLIPKLCTYLVNPYLFYFNKVVTYLEDQVLRKKTFLNIFIFFSH